VSLSASEFAAKWQGVTTTERASSQSHFIDLCRMLDVLTPHEADPTGESYAFEKGAARFTGGDGWADVWKRGHFGWEYKGKHHDLVAAYRQLLDYKDDLENPPLLVVSDMDRIEVHTNFENTKPSTHVVTLEDLRTNPAEALRILRAVMTNPEELRPKQTPDEVTRAAASRFALIARSLQERGHDPEVVAHFLNRVLFCLFAEDVALLPRRIMTELIESRAGDPAKFAEGLAELFRLMSDAGGYFGNDRIEWFNGGLFDGADVIPLTREELRSVRDVSRLDWSQVEPAILGTLFERGLDPSKRGQLGAHYTDREKILMVVEPVVMQPLRREFEAVRERVDALMAGRPVTPLTLDGRRRANLPAWERSAEAAWRAFLDRLRAVRVLDPLAAPATSSTSRCGCSRTSSRRSSSGAQSGCASAVSSRRSGRTTCSASRSTRTPRSWPASRSGSAISSGCSTTATAFLTTRCCSPSKASSSAMPSSPTTPTATPSPPSGRRRSSSWAIRRFWEGSDCARASAASTWKRSTRPGKGVSRGRPI
jgi:hypothetical protein